MNEIEVQPMIENKVKLDYNSNNTNNNNNNNTNNNYNNYNKGEIIGNYCAKGCCDKNVELVWSDLSYSINIGSSNPIRSCLKHKKGIQTQKQLIKHLNGSVVSGQLTAIMGPSGAGKTTLIECLAARKRHGVTGKIFANYNGLKPHIKMAYYSQKDSLTGELSVEESLIYASKLKNIGKNKKHKPIVNNESQSVVSFPDENIRLKLLNDKHYHQIVAQKFMDELNLGNCSKTLVSHLSGGQRRRLSIALELIFSPSILLLDEPTSGLDSLSTLQCVQMLQKLSKNCEKPMVIAASIHQPTARVLSYFDNLYVISFNGQCIYNGSTTQLVENLSKFDLFCPKYHNPSDFMIEVASGDYGLESIDRLAKHYKSICETETIGNGNRVKISKVVQKTNQHSFVNQIIMTWILIKRCFLISWRDPKFYTLRFFSVIAILALIFILYLNKKIGENDGCLKKPTAEELRKLQNFDAFDPESSTYPNFGFIFYSVVFMVFVSMLPTLLSFPLDVSVFMKEHLNGWYSLSSFFVAKNIADLPPNFIFPIIYCIVSFIITGQLGEFWRFFIYIVVMILVSILAQGVGLLVSAYYVNNITSSTVVGATINVPLFLLTGLLIKIKSMPFYFRPICYISYFRLGFEALMVTFYGFHRCPQLEPISFRELKREFGDDIMPVLKCIDDYDPTIIDNSTLAMKFYNGMIEKNPSFALQNFGYEDSVLYFNILYLIIYIIVVRILAYVVLVWRTKVE